ncbi:MAG TPA: ATP-binding protein [Alphaproteobacteria bacterium]|nr:ATP-binding protein [Alphaproteobacteria bacterium]
MAVTIRGKIFLAFCALATITGFLGLYAVSNVVESGRLVVETYDKPLMAISYARLAMSNFTALQLALSQWRDAQDATKRESLAARMDGLARSLHEDLAVAEARSMSGGAATLARGIASGISEWDALRRRLLSHAGDDANRTILDNRAAALIADLDNLVELTAEDGFKDRERALSSIATYRRLSVGATMGALLLSTIVAILLTRRMVHPIAAASHAASRIADGELDVEIVSAGEDELGWLLGSMAVMRDNIRRMMEREIAARRTAQIRLENAIESSAEGVILVDDKNRILISNSQVAKFFPELIDGLVHGAQLPSVLQVTLMQPVGEVRLHDGRWLRVSRSSVADGGFVVIASDITVLKERETFLQAAKDQAEAASRSKSEFLANMSHELRTPLNAIIGFAEVIRESVMGPVDARYRDYANDIHIAGNHLLSLINDVLDLSKIEVGCLEIYKENVNIAEVVAACYRIIADRARGANLDFVRDIPPDLPLVQADQRRLKQIILNLLSNAVKFTPSGGRVVISARALRTGEITLRVSDTGIGMRPEDVAIALEPFRQIDGAITRRYEGTGLGLPLTQNLVELHGGTLAIKTAPSVGTTVTITLPAGSVAREVA